MKFTFIKLRILSYYQVCVKVQLLIIGFAFCISANANNYYWVGGSGNWNDPLNHWASSSGGSNFYAVAPGPGDNVYIDSASFAQTGVISFSGNFNPQMQNINFAGLLFPISVDSCTMNVFGNIDLSNMVNFNSKVVLELMGIDSCLIKCNGAIMPALIGNKNGDLHLMDNYFGISMHFLKGALRTNNFNIQLTNNFLAGPNYSGANSFYFGSSTVVCDSILVDLISGNPSLTAGIYADQTTFNIAKFIQFKSAFNILFDVNCPHFICDNAQIHEITTSKFFAGNASSQKFKLVKNASLPGCGEVEGLYSTSNLTVVDTSIILKSDLIVQDTIQFNGTTSLYLVPGITLQSNNILTVNNGTTIFNVNSTDDSSTVYLALYVNRVCMDYASIKNLHIKGHYIFNAGSHSSNLGNTKGVVYANCVSDTSLLLLVCAGSGNAGDGGRIEHVDLNNGKRQSFHTFDPSNGGAGTGSNPNSGIVKAYNNKLYGTLQSAGNYLYSYEPSSRKYAPLLQTAGQNVFGTMASSADGKHLFGFKQTVGADGIFEYKVDSNSYTLLQAFAGLNSGYEAFGTPCLDSAGNIYGTTRLGGTFNNGVIFKYNPNTNQLTTLHSFDIADGIYPLSGLMLTTSKKLYGTTTLGGSNNQGTLFEFDLNTNTFFNRYDFSSLANLASTSNELILASNGKIYGTAQHGGNSNYGGIFEFDTATNLTQIVALFDSSNTGAFPNGKLLEIEPGQLIGTTTKGGFFGTGCIFNFSISSGVLAPYMNLSPEMQYANWLMQLPHAVTNITLQCRDTNYCIGGNAQFSVQTNGTKQLSYAWQDSSQFHSWQNINYGTFYSPVLNLFALDETFDGRKFRCIIMDYSDTIISNSAQLTSFKVSLPHTVNYCATSNPICATIIAGVPAVAYWNDGSILSTCRTFDNSGQYILNVTNTEGCVDTALITIGTGQTIQVTTQQQSSSCGMCDGTLQTSVFPANAIYTVSYSVIPAPNLTAICEGDTFTVFYTDTFNCIGLTHVVMPYACNGDVWPGDANVDFTANNFDLLPIGLAYGATGTTRQNASLAWVGQYSADWLQTQLNGADYKHIDGNGDGLIDAADTLPINLNYGYVHPRQSLVETNSTAPSLYFTYVNDTVMAGDTLLFEIGLGTVILPADSVYGIAFTINYSKEVVDSNSAHISHAQCWMGTPNINLLTLQHDNYSNGKIDCAIVGTDHLNKQGFGTIGVLGIDMKDDLSGRDSLIKTLNLSFSNLRFIDSDGTEKPLNAINDSIVVWQDITKLQEYTMQHNSYSVYPNPASDFVTIDLSKLKQQVTKVSLVNMYGVEVYSTSNLQEGKLQLSTKNYNAGVYSVQVKTMNSILSKKLIITTRIH